MEQQATPVPVQPPRLDEQKMFTFIAEQLKSGLTVKAFCEKHQLSPHTYYYWNKKYKARNKPPDDKPSGFSQLNIQDRTGRDNHLFCELITPSGNQLRFYQPVPVSFLQSLL